MEAEEFKRDYLPLWEGLYRVALHILEDREEATDVLQDLYLKLGRTRDNLDGVNNPRAYCLRVLRNLCLDRVRHLEALPTGSLEDIPPSAIQGESPPSDSLIEGRELRERILREVDSLPPLQARAIRLRTIEQMDYPEIASLTGQSEGALRYLVSEGRKRLRKSLMRLEESLPHQKPKNSKTTKSI